MPRIAIVWVQQYHGAHHRTDLSNTRKQTEGLYNALRATRQFELGDDDARDEVFEQQGLGVPPTGRDVLWVETVDMVYFSGHGEPRFFLFGVGDDARAKPAEIRWGDEGRLKWVVVDGCNVLFQPDDGSGPTAIDRWGQVFAGIHYMLGFHSVADDEADRGRIFAQYLNAGHTIADAWIKACQDTEQSFSRWAYIRAEIDGMTTSEDRWPVDEVPTTSPAPPQVLHYVSGAC